MRSGSLVLWGALLATGGAGLLATNHPAELREEFHHTYLLDAHGRVAVDNLNGSVRISGWDRNEVEVEALKHAGNRRDMDDARILIDAAQDAVMIRTGYPSSGAGIHPAAVEYTIRVPRGANLDQIKLVNGTVEIRGVVGEVRASSVNGTVHAEKLAGDARLSTVNGRLDASFERLDSAHTVQLHSVNGSITLALPYNARASLRASNVTGGITNGFGLSVDRGPFAGSRLQGRLKGGGTEVRVDSVNGAIHIVAIAGGKLVKFT